MAGDPPPADASLAVVDDGLDGALTEEAWVPKGSVSIMFLTLRVYSCTSYWRIEGVGRPMTGMETEVVFEAGLSVQQGIHEDHCEDARVEGDAAGLQANAIVMDLGCEEVERDHGPCEWLRRPTKLD